jgi:nucleotide-binding universal stress UspA family protein
LWDPETFFDEETEKNTEANAYYADAACDDAIDSDTKRDNFDVYGEDVERDLLGEGPNVVVAPEPLFAKPGDKVRKSERSGLDLITSRPTFARDRCTIQLTQGDPDAVLDVSGKRMRRYVVLSDLSEESRYAVEWAIGTVARDGDEVFLISVNEDESKVDPKSWSSKDQQNKMKVQKERQTTALLLVRQVTGLLERTRLNITVTCQAMHAKNARYMLLDVIDFLEPTLVIVGSRGLGQLKG